VHLAIFSNALTPSEVNQKLGHTCVANETASLPNSNPLSFANFFCPSYVSCVCCCCGRGSMVIILWMKLFCCELCEELQ